MRDKNIIFKDLDEWDKFVKPKYSHYEEMYNKMKDNGWKEGWLGAKEEVYNPKNPLYQTVSAASIKYHVNGLKNSVKKSRYTATELLNMKFRYDIYDINDKNPSIITTNWGRKKHKKEPLFKITPEVLLYLMKRMKIKEQLSS